MDIPEQMTEAAAAVDGREQVIDGIRRQFAKYPQSFAEWPGHRLTRFLESIYDVVIAPLLAEARREAYGAGRDDEANGLPLRDQT